MSSDESESPAVPPAVTDTEVEPIDVRLARQYYISSTAAAGAAAAAAIAARLASTANSSRPAKMSTRPTSNSKGLPVSGSNTTKRRNSDDSALDLVDVEQLGGTMVAIEVCTVLATAVSQLVLVGFYLLYMLHRTSMIAHCSNSLPGLVCACSSMCTVHGSTQLSSS